MKQSKLLKLPSIACDSFAFLNSRLPYVGRSPHIGSYKVGYPQNVRLVSHTTFSEALVFEREKKTNIAQKSYCSRDIYFQFKEVRRSFISLANW